MAGTGPWANVGMTHVSTEIPMYSQFYKNDYDETYMKSVIESEYPDIWATYNKIKGGNMRSPFLQVEKRLFSGRAGPTPTAAEQAQQYLDTVIPQVIWSRLMAKARFPITTTSTSTTGQVTSSTTYENFTFPLFQYNFKDEHLLNTGNIAAPNFTDNGVSLVPLQMTSNPIFYQLLLQLQTSQYFAIKNNTIDIDLGGIENDLNGKGSINVIYVPPGTNQSCDWETLMSQSNGNFRTQFGIAEAKTKFKVIIDNSISKDGCFQCVRNNPGGQSSAQIINSAGFIFLLNNKRTQDNYNPCLGKLIPGTSGKRYQITQASDWDLIMPDGYAKVSMTIMTKGQNADSSLYPIYSRLGQMVVQGEYVPKGSSGGGGGGGDTPELYDEQEQAAKKPQGNNGNANTIKKKTENTDAEYEEDPQDVVQPVTLAKRGDSPSTQGKNTKDLLAIGIPNYMDGDEYFFRSYMAGNNYPSTLSVSIPTYNGVIPNIDVNISSTNAYKIWGIIPSTVSNAPVIQIGENIFNALGSANNPMLYYGYQLPSNTESNPVSINFCGIPYLGTAESSLNVPNAVIQVSASGFNPDGSDLYTDSGSLNYHTSGQYFSSKGVVNLYEEPVADNGILQKIFRKMVNVGTNIVKGVVQAVTTDEKPDNDLINIVVSNAAFQGSATKSYTSTISTMDAEEKLRFYGNASCYHPLSSSSPSDYVSVLYNSGYVNSIPNIDSPYLFDVNISFDMKLRFNIVRTNITNSASSSDCTMTLEVHPIFLAVSKDPKDITDMSNLFQNSVMLDSYDLTEHSFDLECAKIPPSEVGTKLLMINLNIPSTYVNHGAILNDTTPALPITEAYHPCRRICHVEGTYQFQRPAQLKKSGTMTATQESDTFYVVVILNYNVNLQDSVNITAENTPVSYIVLPDSISTTSDTNYISTYVQNGKFNASLASGAGTNTLIGIDNLVLQTSFMDRTNNPTQTAYTPNYYKHTY